MDAIINGSPFMNCRGGASSAGNELYLRLHREYEFGKDIWHKIKQDFDGDAWTRSVTVNAEDGQRSGSGRTRQDIQSFGETLDFTLNNDYHAPFNQSLYDVTLHGDRYFMDFLRDGIDVKIIQHFPDGSHIEKIYLCNSVLDAGALYDQLDNADSTSDFSISLNNEPTVLNFGFSPKLPAGIREVTADVAVTVADFQVDVKVTNVVDDDSLIFDDTWLVTVVDNATGEIVSTTTSTTAPHEFTITVPSSGEYTVATGYIFYSSGTSGQQYGKYISIKKVTATAPADPSENTGDGTGTQSDIKTFTGSLAKSKK